jgi:S-adenosylmethionine hydrolase
VVNCDGRWLVGPGNGLFDIVIKRAKTSKQWDIHWRPESLSSSFHGRDLFAPVAAMLAMGQRPDLQPLALDEDRLAQLPDDLAEVIYIDHFGNLISGIRSASVTEGGCLFYQGTVIPRVKTFADVATGRPLCYENSNGLLEISVNQGRAERYFESQIGDRLEIVSPII